MYSPKRAAAAAPGDRRGILVVLRLRERQLDQATNTNACWWST